MLALKSSARLFRGHVVSEINDSGPATLLVWRLDQIRIVKKCQKEVQLADNQLEEYFVERVANMSHANGVFRITLAQQEEGADLRQVVRLMIPANQLAGILQGISGAAKNIGEQVQARTGDTKQVGSKKAATKSKTNPVSKKKAKAKK